jgi:hypothetical protein
MGQIALSLRCLTSLPPTTVHLATNADLVANITDLLESASNQHTSLTALLALSCVYLGSQSYNKIRQHTSKAIAQINAASAPVAASLLGYGVHDNIDHCRLHALICVDCMECNSDYAFACTCSLRNRRFSEQAFARHNPRSRQY